MRMIFVYGTLKRGHSNFALLDREDVKFVGERRTFSRFTMYSLGRYPGIIRGGSTAIHGEVFSVPDHVLKALDRLEGHPNFYQRQDEELPTGEEVELYVLPEEDARNMQGVDIIHTGEWV